jgi:hypothetical protein
MVVFDQMAAGRPRNSNLHRPVCWPRSKQPSAGVPLSGFSAKSVFPFAPNGTGNNKSRREHGEDDHVLITVSLRMKKRDTRLRSGPSFISMYSSETRPSLTGNKPSHFTQPNLRCCTSLGTCRVTMMYFAPQQGQSNAFGSDLLVTPRGHCAH